MSDFTICVATFGDPGWITIAQCALRSAYNQAPAIHFHGDSDLADARNQCLAQVETEFVIFLDADDELEDGYVAALNKGSADVRAPRVRYIRNGNARSPFLPHVVNCTYSDRHPGQDCVGTCLPFGNWIVIGAGVRTELLRTIGGFGPEPIFEDWALWLRCWKAGASFEAIHDAIYRQHFRIDSRNHTGEAWERRAEWHHRIVFDITGSDPLVK